MACYVNNLLLFASKDMVFNQIKATIRRLFIAKNLGQPRQFLVFKINWSHPDRVTVCQSGVTERLLLSHSLFSDKMTTFSISSTVDVAEIDNIKVN